MPSPFRLDLSGQVAVVTGASSGIGAAIARMLGAAGAAVGVNYRGHREGAEEVVAAVRAAGGRAEAIAADVSQEEDVERLFARAVEAFGTVHILVANAGLQRDAPAHELSLADCARSSTSTSRGSSCAAAPPFASTCAVGGSPRSRARSARSSASRPCTRSSPGPGT